MAVTIEIMMARSHIPAPIRVLSALVTVPESRKILVPRMGIIGAKDPGSDALIRAFYRSHSSGSIFTIEAPWLLPTQKVDGIVEKRLDISV